MTTHTDLEISLSYRDSQSYAVELRFRDPDSQTEDPRQRGIAQLDHSVLLAQQQDDRVYGRTLTEQLFADQKLAEEFRRAYSVSSAANKTLRVRLFIDPPVSELHAVHWEKLCMPGTDEWLSTNQRLLFSRFLGSAGLRPVRLRSRGVLRALIVIANPTDLGQKYPDLAPLDVAAERDRALTNLATMVTTECSRSATAHAQATLNSLVACLRAAAETQQGYDIVYLVCHGLSRPRTRQLQAPEETFLVLEDDAGNADIVASSDLVHQIKNLPQLPWLMVLASCSSAGSGNHPLAPAEQSTSDIKGALAALGPRLAEAGVPAVVAIQGSIMVSTIAQFMPVFFQQLSEHGHIDHAMSVARSQIQRDCSDWWRPALYMRLRDGRIWAPFSTGTQRFEQWPVLLDRINARGASKRCVPILGPGLMNPLLGSIYDLAQQWAEKYGFPMAKSSTEDLPYVAQFLSVHQDVDFLYNQYLEYLLEQIKQRYAGSMPAELQDVYREQYAQVMQEVTRAIWETNPREAHLVLAKLPMKAYITTNPDTMMELALRKVGKTPRRGIFSLGNDLIDDLDADRRKQTYAPAGDRIEYRDTEPLMYYLFGNFENLDSLVLTADDFFDYLLAVGKERSHASSILRTQVDDTLLFLGFQLDDWCFRVLLRSLQQLEGSNRRKRHINVAIQIFPEDGRLLETERACRYLEKYFGTYNISIYWGTPEEFIQELVIEWNKQYPDRPI